MKWVQVIKSQSEFYKKIIKVNLTNTIWFNVFLDIFFYPADNLSCSLDSL